MATLESVCGLRCISSRGQVTLRKNDGQLVGATCSVTGAASLGGFGSLQAKDCRGSRSGSGAAVHKLTVVLLCYLGA